MFCQWLYWYIFKNFSLFSKAMTPPSIARGLKNAHLLAITGLQCSNVALN